MPEPAHRAAPPAEVETNMTRIYVLVVIVEALTIAALYVLQRVYA
jgi:hypothetical protein